MSTWQSKLSIEVLRARSTLLKKIREFFEKNQIIEVETPSISQFPSIEEHIDSIKVDIGKNANPRYLITSPEYHMKRLLVNGFPSIYQICKAFRKDELGSRHNPEFTMIEWYQLDCDDKQLMNTIDSFLQFTINAPAAEFLSYQQVFKDLLNLDPFTYSHQDFLNSCQLHGLQPPDNLISRNCSKIEQLNFLMGMYVESKVGQQKPTFIYHYPADQSALSKINPDFPHLSHRFEVFYKGMELGNGYYELQDFCQHQKRFESIIFKREKTGKDDILIDQNFMDSIKVGLPRCSGIAMGFDRLLMIKTGSHNIDQVISFTADNC